MSNNTESISSSQGQQHDKSSPALDRYLDENDAYTCAITSGTSDNAHQEEAAEVIKDWNDASQDSATANGSNSDSTHH